MNKKYLDSRKGSVEATINTIRTEQKTIVKEEPKVSLQPKSYFGQKKDSLADVAAKVVSVNEDTNIYIGNDKKKKEEDVDVDSVNDMALKNAEKHKSKDKESEGKESKSLTKEEQDHIKKEFGIKDSQITLGTLARISPEKGLEYLIESFHIIKKEYPNTKLIIVLITSPYLPNSKKRPRNVS